MSLIAIYVASEFGVIYINLLIISGVILAADIILFLLSANTFQRKEILMKWIWVLMYISNWNDDFDIRVKPV